MKLQLNLPWHQLRHRHQQVRYHMYMTEKNKLSQHFNKIHCCMNLLQKLFSPIIDCNRGLAWCKDSTEEEAGNCCSDYDCSLDTIRLLPDPEGVAARRPICWYKGGVPVGTVDCSLAAPSAKAPGTTCYEGIIYI